MRYNGMFFEKVNCSGFRKAFNLPILFSFKVQKISEGELKASGFLPPGIVDFLQDREIFLFDPLNKGKSCIVKAYVKDANNDSCTFVLGEKVAKDRRLFERFSFCPEKLGEFHVQDEEREIKGIYIVDISLKGVKLLFRNLEPHEIREGQILTLTQDGKILVVKVLRKEEGGNGLIVGCEILKANFNIMKFIMDNYVKHVKEILFRNV